MWSTEKGVVLVRGCFEISSRGFFVVARNSGRN